ncbi:MAG TPA: MEDS domain-containing protein [Actinomycetospora sp.]|uniref:MEDS domain-containing protein n=1 Tax=Actinomycetospora sp. TaxID=1872135 RepID=UPI002F40A8B6
MFDGISLGFGGIEAAVGDHICGLYTGASQRDEVVIPFLEIGLAAGEKCICVVDGTDPAEIVSSLGTHVHASERTATGQLEVIGASDMYLRSGRFSADEVIGSWKAEMSDVMYDGRFDVVRAVETWSRRDVVPDMHELLVLESEMNRYLPLYPQVILCLYDIGRFGGGMIVNLLRTHARVLLGSVLMENPYYQTPDEFLAGSPLGGGDTAIPPVEEAAAWCFDVTTGST